MDKTDKNEFTVIAHSREKFYGKPVYWYRFILPGVSNLKKRLEYDGLIPDKFLRVPETNYYEYGGNHEQALNDLTSSGFTRIIYGNEL
jgi:hypothetical protein